VISCREGKAVKNNTLSSAPPLRLGLIGAGRWGRNVIRAAGALDGVRLTRVGSSNPQTAGLVGPGCIVCTDWQDALDPSAIDGVVIATPPALHADMVRTALERDIPVLVEKPLTADWAEAEGIRELAKARQGLVLVDHIHLFSPAFQALAELAQAVGPIRALRGRAGNFGPFREDVSVLWDWGPHDVSMALALLGGRPETVMARRLSRDEKGEVISLGLTFAGGVEAEFTLGNILPAKARMFAAHTDRLVLVYDDLAADKLTVHPPTAGFADPTGPGEPIAISPEPPLTIALTTFAEAIRSNERATESLDLGVDVVAVLSACEKALGESLSL